MDFMGCFHFLTQLLQCETTLIPPSGPHLSTLAVSTAEAGFLVLEFGLVQQQEHHWCLLPRPVVLMVHNSQGRCLNKEPSGSNRKTPWASFLS